MSRAWPRVAGVVPKAYTETAIGKEALRGDQTPRPLKAMYTAKHRPLLKRRVPWKL